MGDSDEELALMEEVENLSIKLFIIGHTLDLHFEGKIKLGTYIKAFGRQIKKMASQVIFDLHFEKKSNSAIISKLLADSLRKWQVR
jgi:hypothetical protein